MQIHGVCIWYLFITLPWYCKIILTLTIISISHALFTETSHYIWIITFNWVDFFFVPYAQLKTALYSSSDYNSVLWQLRNTHLHTVVHLADHTHLVLQSVCGWRVEEDIQHRKTNNSIQPKHNVTPQVVGCVTWNTSFKAAHLRNRSSVCFRAEGCYFAQINCSCLRKLLLCFSHAWLYFLFGRL